MKVAHALGFLACAAQINAAAVPEAKNTLHILPLDDRAPDAAALVSPDHTLEKRKGGGGRGGGSSGGSSSGGGRSGGSSSSGRTSGSSAAGGATSAGSGPARGFGGGKYYGGGAATPYRAGGRTPNGLIAGALIAPVALLAIMPGIWLYNAYPYHYNRSYNFRNQSATNSNSGRSVLLTRQSTGQNETLPVLCLCQDFAVCGCDENADQSYIDDLIGNGSYAALNKTLVTVSDVNNTKTLVLNGTLPNGTTAPGGTDDDEGAAINLALGKYTGYWAMGLIVLYGVFL